MEGANDATIQYSPSARATCDYCRGTIEKGELRITKKTRSDHHDGFDIKWNHARCQLKYYNCTSLKGLESLHHSDILEIMELRPQLLQLFDELKNETKEEKEKYIKESDDLWAVIDELENNLKVGQIKDLLNVNSLPTEKVDFYDQLFFLGVGLYHGLLDPCPICKMSTLLPYRNKVKCRGRLGYTRCTYIGDLSNFPNRYQMKIEGEGAKNKFLKEWKHPKPELAKLIKQRLAGDQNGENGQSGEAGPSKIEYELPTEGNECEGLVITFLGQGIPSEAKELVTSHGGDISKSVTKNTTHVLVSDPEQVKHLKAIKDALDKALPILPLKYLYDLVGYQEEGEELPEEIKPEGEEEVKSKVNESEQSKPEESRSEESKPDENKADENKMDVVTDEKKDEEEQPQPEPAPAQKGRGKGKSKQTEPAPVPVSTRATRSRGKKVEEEQQVKVEETKVEVKEETKPAAKGRKRKVEETEEKKVEEKVEKGKQKVVGKKKPNVQLRLPEVLKESGLLLLDSLPGEAWLEEAGKNKKIKIEEGPPLLPPKPGSEVLKVDPASKLQSKGEIHLTSDGLIAYNVMLNNVDLITGKNRFYVIQIIKTGKTSFNLFKRWGRTGGDGFNGDKTEKYNSEKGAVAGFIEKFEDATGNKWANYPRFQTVPGKYSVVVLDDGNDSVADDEVGKSASKEEHQNITVSQSKLDERQRNLMKLMFNAKELEKALAQMNIDTKKMPLGKLSKTTIIEAYKVLKEIEELIEKLQADPNMQILLLDASTKFYTLIPHYFPNSMVPPVISNKIILEEKILMLDSLLDMEIAGKLMGKKIVPNKEGVVQDELDAHYDSLEAELKPLDKSSKEYEIIVDYTKNKEVKIEVLDIFYIERKGEKDRFEPWKENPNRLLLWHGSRLTNWVGIISQGLRIAPPEAPVSGYLFGKGVYFANMVSKSANYCRVDSRNPVALMSLSEVALGNMYEVKRPEYMEKPKNGYQSTKALGRQYPDPKGDVPIHDKGPIVPLGKLLENKATTMGHDEFIVYDISQIQARYLLHVQLKY